MLQLLEAAAPLLEALELSDAGPEHLQLLLLPTSMPRLRRLHLSGDSSTLAAGCPVAPPLPERGPEQGPEQGRGHPDAGVHWLRAYHLPRTALASLLTAHGHSLRELWLFVGTAGEQWSERCGDLPSLLGRCELRALTRLVLLRAPVQPHVSPHSPPACRDQLQAVRAALPPPPTGTTADAAVRVRVQCVECDQMEEGDFCSDPPGSQ